MKVCFLGNTHLTFCSVSAAARRGIIPVPQREMAGAELIIIAQDVRTDAYGKRDLQEIEDMLAVPNGFPTDIIVISSQVPPGWARQRASPNLFLQPETLRIVDATERAYKPERIVVGCMNPDADLPAPYLEYLNAFQAPVIKMSYEDAEFSKIAVNVFLAAQVDVTNRLANAAAKCGADWDAVKQALMLDRRIGPHAYLTPGRWQDSPHLLRDHVTLEGIEDA